MGKATNPNNGQKIAYVYDASGTKLRQAVIATNGTVTKTTDYIGGMQYETAGLEASGKDFWNHEEYDRIW